MIDDPQRTQQIIHKHVHDVRNSINCLALEAVWLDHLATDPEVAASVERMRRVFVELEATMESLQLEFPVET